MSDLAFIFPGQGAQFVGMGKELADTFRSAKAVFEEVDAALGQSLTSIMWEGPESDLTLTSNTQPALMAVSVASMRALDTEFGISVEQAKFVAGHSLGEYSALCASGAMSLADTAKLLRIRGNAMQAAVAPGIGAMAALLGADPNQAQAACEAGRAASSGICEIANDNAPGQIVLSGSAEAIDAACAYARENGVKKAVPLSVSAPFHCSLMLPAARKMHDALQDTKIVAPKVSLMANVSATPTSDPETIRRQLIEQVTARVRWRESVLAMHEAGVTKTAEAGAGKVLTVMNRRTVRELKGATLGTPADLEAFAADLNGQRNQIDV
ncbi:MAG: ACP S-malonyltransferase [Pseudomonadota bacterium]